MDQKFTTHDRQSIRLQDYDYSSPGLYFVTIVSYKWFLIFSEIVAGEIKLSQIGKIVEGCWLNISLHFQDVSVEAYVIMPNHFHGIVKINEKRNVGGDVEDVALFNKRTRLLSQRTATSIIKYNYWFI
jgi:REP element-mobilizing transposase RayT